MVQALQQTPVVPRSLRPRLQLDLRLLLPVLHRLQPDLRLRLEALLLPRL